MLSLYQQSYSFRAVMFSTSPSVLSICQHYNITTISSFEVNMYNLPVLKSLLLLSKKRYACTYVGYINSDILISPSLFDALSICLAHIQTGVLDTNVKHSSLFIHN